MNDFLKISVQGLRLSQSIGLMNLLIIQVAVIINLYFKFSYASLAMLFIVSLIIYLTFFRSTYREIYYQNGKIYLISLFKKEIYDIAMFKEITPNIIGYSIIFTNENTYNFRLPPIDNLKSFFKSDPAFYAKKLNNQLLEKKIYYVSAIKDTSQ